MKKAYFAFLAVLSVGTFSMLTLSQSGGTFVIQKSVIAGGGGSSSGGTFDMNGTIGEPFAGSTSVGGMFSVSGGYWNAGPFASATPTPTPSGSISGTVTYGNAIPAATRFVSNVTISGNGSMLVSALTGFPNGDYVLSGFGSGSYTVTPSKVGGVNGSIGSFDAARIAQHAAGPPLPQLTGNQLLVADVSNNGLITSFDAGMVAKFAAGPPYAAPGIGLTGTWKFIPVNRSYASIASNIAGEDYSALLMGEVTGNWTNTGARPMGTGPERSVAVAAPRLVTSADSDVVVPITIDGAANKGIISYEFDLRYDASVIQPQADPVDFARTASSKLSAVANAEESGRIRVIVYGPMPINSNGLLLNLRFVAVGAPGAISKLTWERLIFNEGDPATTTADGQVELSAAPSQADISGRLLTAFGAVVPNSRVKLIDSGGRSRAILSNAAGFYRFGHLQVGQTYTIRVESRQYTFKPVSVSVTGQPVNVDVIAEP